MKWLNDGSHFTDTILVLILLVLFLTIELSSNPILANIAWDAARAALH